jgi:hypothetical protein
MSVVRISSAVMSSGSFSLAKRYNAPATTRKTIAISTVTFESRPDSGLLAYHALATRQEWTSGLSHGRQIPMNSGIVFDSYKTIGRPLAPFNVRFGYVDRF